MREDDSAAAAACGILGLDESQAGDPRALKRAYAVMLKRHRPDQDPEGFRRVRDAYEMLTALHALARSGDADEAPAGLVPSAPFPSVAEAVQPFAEPAPPVDDDLARAIARLSSLAMVGDATTEVIPAAREVWALARAPGQADRGLAAFARILGTRPQVLGLVLEDAGVLQAFDQGHEDVAMAVLKHWETHEPARVLHFVRELQAHLGKGYPQFAFLALRLAERLALREPKVADNLLNRVFIELPAHLREATTIVEQRVALGRTMIYLPALVRTFVWEALDRDAGTPAPPVPADVLTGLEQLPANHPLRTALQAALPDVRIGYDRSEGQMWANFAKMSSPSGRDHDLLSLRARFLLVGLVVLTLLSWVLTDLRSSSTTLPTWVTTPSPARSPENVQPPVEVSVQPPLETPAQPSSTPAADHSRRDFQTRPLTPKEKEMLRRALETGVIRVPRTRPSQPTPSEGE